MITQAEIDAVTDDEINIWLFAVPNITSQTREVIRENYIRSYAVRQKIIYAKRDGRFQKLIEQSQWVLPIAQSIQNCVEGAK